MTKHRFLPRTLLAAAGAALLLTTAQAGGGDSGLTREQVRAELFEARAAGLLDEPEAGATAAVLAAREAWNATQSLLLQARLVLDAQLLSAAMAVDGEPDLDIYYEMGPDGPRMVLLTYDGDGALHSADTLMLASMD